MKKKINKFFAYLCVIIGTFLSAYVGIWLLLVKPLELLLVSFSEGKLTMSILLTCVLKIAFSMTFAGLVWCIGYVGYNHFIGTEDPDWEAIERERGRKEDENIDS